jgi:hypothetical protein
VILYVLSIVRGALHLASPRQTRSGSILELSTLDNTNIDRESRIFYIFSNMPGFTDNDRPDPSHFMGMTRVRDGETNRPDDYLPGTNPFDDAERKKQKAQKKFASADYTGSSRVGDWLGGSSPSKPRRSWKVKEPTKASINVGDNDKTTGVTPITNTTTGPSSMKNSQNTASAPVRRWKPPSRENSIPPPWMSATSSSSSSSSKSKLMGGSASRTSIPPKWKIQRPSQVSSPVNESLSFESPSAPKTMNNAPQFKSPSGDNSVDNSTVESNDSPMNNTESMASVILTKEESKPVDDATSGPQKEMLLQQKAISISTVKMAVSSGNHDNGNDIVAADIVEHDDYEVDSDMDEEHKVGITDVAPDIDSVAGIEDDDGINHEDDNDVFGADSFSGECDESVVDAYHKVESEAEEEKRCKVEVRELEVEDEISQVDPGLDRLEACVDDDCSSTDGESYEVESDDEKGQGREEVVNIATSEPFIQAISKPPEEIKIEKSSDDVEIENIDEVTGILFYEIETDTNLKQYQETSASKDLVQKSTLIKTSSYSFVDESVYPDDDRPDPREFMIMTQVRDGETDRPDDYLPGTDPFAGCRRKKEKAKKKYSGADTSGKSRVDDWLGSGTKPQQRSWQIKTS